MKIIVFRYRFIGDTILTVPFLRNLRRAYPGATIDLVVAPYSSDVLMGIPYVNELIIYDPPTIHADSRGTHASLRSKMAFIGDLRRRRYDRAYVLKRSLSSAVIAYLTGARERVGFDTEGRGFLLTKKVSYRHDQHEVQNFLDVLRADSIDVADDHLEAWLDSRELEFSHSFLKDRGVGEGETLIAIHPFTANIARSWHEENFIEVANEIQSKWGFRVMIFGGERDREMSNYFQQRVNPSPVMAVGETDLRQTMSLLKACKLLICNDSGIMHVGAALGTPLIAIFGPQSPVKFGPWGEKCSIMYREFPCSPCRQKFFTECEPSERGRPYCLEEITPVDVMGEASRILETLVEEGAS